MHSVLSKRYVSVTIGVVPSFSFSIQSESYRTVKTVVTMMAMASRRGAAAIFVVVAVVTSRLSSHYTNALHGISCYRRCRGHDQRRLLFASSPSTKTTLPVLRWSTTDETVHGTVISNKARRLPLMTAVQDLRNLLQLNQTDHLVHVEGYVIAKRGFGNSFCFVDVADAHCFRADHPSPPVQVILKRRPNGAAQLTAAAGKDDPSSPLVLYFDGYMQSMLPGIKVGITGVVTPSKNPTEALLLARQIEILSLPRNPQHIRILLQAVHNGQLPVEEVARAAQWSAVDLTAAITAAVAAHPTTTTTTRKLYQLARDIVKSLPPPDSGYPAAILATKNQRGVHTLRMPDKHVQHPPLELQQHVLNENHRKAKRNTTTSGIGMPLTVRELVASHAFSIFNLNRTTTSSGTTMHVTTHQPVVGWVQNRRRFLHNVTVLDVVDQRVAVMAALDGDQPPQQRLQCVLHGAVVTTTTDHGAKTTVAILGQLLAPGSQVQLQGHYCCSCSSTATGNEGEESSDVASPLFWVTQVQILRSSWRPSVVLYLIELFVQGIVDRREAARALRLTDVDISSILGLKDLTARQWKAAEISVNLQYAESRVSSISSEQMRVLNKFVNLRTRYPLQSIDSVELPMSPTGEPSHRVGSRFKRKKEPQLYWMAQQVKEVIQSHPDFQQRPLKILDVGGGKGYLANHLAGLLGDDVQIQVIDVAQRAVKNGAMRSKRLQLPVEYTFGDASIVDFTGDVDMVVALHACGALTDVALGHALANAACFVICPCCFRSNPQLQVTLPSTDDSGIHRIRADDWLGVDQIDYDTLKLLAELQGDMAIAKQAMHSICALRASAVIRRMPGSFVEVSIRAFPMAFSTRNICLVGSYIS